MDRSLSQADLPCIGAVFDPAGALEAAVGWWSPGWRPAIDGAAASGDRP